MSHDPIADEFDVEPIQKKDLVKVEPRCKDIHSPESEDEDLNNVREGLTNTIGTTQQAIENMFAVADQSESPRAYEVLANLIKTYSELNKDLLTVHEKKKIIKAVEKEEEPSEMTVNNVVVRGTLKDALKALDES